MPNDSFVVVVFFYSQLLYDGFTESAQHLATNLVNLSSLTQCVSSNELLDLYKTRENEQGNAVATPFWSDSIAFNESRVASVIVELSQY